VLIGQGLRMRYDPMVDMIDAGELARFMDDMVEVIADVAGAMPMQHRSPLQGAAAAWCCRIGTAGNKQQHFRQR
jgi:hypothetical protein